jgi:hypothetical protein
MREKESTLPAFNRLVAPIGGPGITRVSFCIQRINPTVLSFIAAVLPAHGQQSMAVRPKSPSFAFAFIVMIALALFAPLAGAEQPPATTTPPAESKKSAAPRIKPQIIYRLPRVSGYAAALHSQAKTPDNSLPITPDMPISLQMSRAAANAEANAANQPSPQPPAEQPEKRPNIQPTQQSPSRSPSHRSNMRNKALGKAHGPGNSHGNKSHKK